LGTGGFLLTQIFMINLDFESLIPYFALQNVFIITTDSTNLHGFLLTQIFMINLDFESLIPYFASQNVFLTTDSTNLHGF